MRVAIEEVRLVPFWGDEPSFRVGPTVDPVRVVEGHLGGTVEDVIDGLNSKHERMVLAKVVSE